MHLHITPSAPHALHGTVTTPGSKSHTMRAILLASLAHGASTLGNVLPSPDTAAMISACSALGAAFSPNGPELVIQGTGGRLSVPATVIDVGNSGQVLRFVAALATLVPQYTVLTGDHSICTLRPMAPLLEGLGQLGAFAVSSKGDGRAPVIVRGPARAGHMDIDGQDSQPVSALLMLAAFLDGTSSISVRNPGETPWVGLTLHWLDKLGIPYTNDGYRRYTVTGPARYDGFCYTVPADWSSAAFPLGAALVANSELTLENMDCDDCQGDKAIVDALERMGAMITRSPATGRLTVHRHSGLHGARIEVNDFIDAVPILAAIACYADSPTTISGAAIARQKESDRLHTITLELRKMGARIDELPDGLVVHPAQLHGATVFSHHDHRIAMACAVAALGASSPSQVEQCRCVDKSFPGFAAVMQGLGAQVRELSELSERNGDIPAKAATPHPAVEKTP